MGQHFFGRNDEFRNMNLLNKFSPTKYCPEQRIIKLIEIKVAELVIPSFQIEEEKMMSIDEVM